MRDFFEHQHRARQNTTRLVALFVAAVLLIIVLVYLIVAGAYTALAGYQDPRAAPGGWSMLWQPGLLAVIVPAVVGIVGIASAVRLVQLRAGGRAVAEALGGRLIPVETTDLQERQVLNVVEEMAIASGVPVPPVYVMDDEHAINAFAAGRRPEDAVIGVTRGSLEQLGRDELQGVIAHEFSHILNGDMRLNLRLVGVLFGILAIGVIGQTVLRSARFMGGSRRGRSGKGGGAAILVILGAAVALWVIGYAGVFAARLIKAAISRQREFLADASAVQFTRNPAGIGGALKKIGGLSLGSRLLAADAEEFSHMYFGQGIANHLGAMAATHPPLPERIRRIEPGWDGELPGLEPPPVVQQRIEARREGSTARSKRLAGEAARAAAAGLAAAPQARRLARAAVADIGQPGPEHVELARALLASIPPVLRRAAQEPYSARAVVLGLLIDPDAEVADRQLARLGELGDPPAEALVRELRPVFAGLDDRARLPLLDLAAASLRGLAPAQHAAFRRAVRALIVADDRVSLFEWTLAGVLDRRLSPAFDAPAKAPRPGIHAIKPVAGDLSVVLSVLARQGASDEPAASRAVALAAHAAKLDGTISLLPAARCGIAELERSLRRLERLTAPLKRRVILACTGCIAADHEVTVREAELMRGIADAMGVPMPPLLPGQRLA